MSSGIAELAPKEDDITKMLKAKVHIGSKNKNFQMNTYIHSTNDEGHNIFNLHKTWEKMLLAARVLVTVENPKDICAISGRPFGTRAVLKFCKHIGATSRAGRYTPGTFTNQIQKAFIEPRILVVTDPVQDHQPIRESSYVNVPVIALCNAETPLRFIDVAIPCNNAGVQSIGVMWWFLAREYLRLRGTITRSYAWDVMPDLYFYRDPDEVEKEEQEKKLAETTDNAGYGNQWDNTAPDPDAPEWSEGQPAPDVYEAGAAGVAQQQSGDWNAGAAPPNMDDGWTSGWVNTAPQ